MSTVNQAVARPLRTAGQGTVAEITIQMIEAFWVDLNEAQHVALLGALTIAYGILQVLIENKSGKAILRHIPPMTAPVTSSVEDNLEQTDNRPRPEDGEQLPPEERGDTEEWTGQMR